MIIGIFSSSLRAATSDELKAAIQAANPSELGHFTVQLEEKGKTTVLKIGRKISINPLHYVIEVQSVDLRRLEPLPVVEKIGNRVQPWVKLRCKQDRDDVQVIEQVYVEEELNEVESSEEERSVLVIPCDPYEVEKLAEVLADFIEKN
ncbi:MAG: hypothetical protein AAF571_00115 [Verrucomicrobiota bacterium]